MKFRGTFVCSAFAFALLLAGSMARAADNSIVGVWNYTAEDRQVEMDFAKDGNCLIKVTSKGKTGTLEGGYSLGGGKL
ncbi:MAG TPA: hypothetical protein VLJ39_07315, partial [Tepidisphaeraceae bacterium]|nr:hypothetical protein [Tepidisphaeraceae bacterium]